MAKDDYEVLILKECAEIIKKSVQRIQAVEQERDLALVNYEGQRRNTAAFARELEEAKGTIQKLENDNTRMLKVLKIIATSYIDYNYQFHRLKQLAIAAIE